MSMLTKFGTMCHQEMLSVAFLKAWLHYVNYGVITTTNYICLWTN